ncbi:NAD(P)H-hydrate dehydratase [Aquirhabdus parva]|uniref:ADP-dependent (S)-NAD(P)H-hydrate dehydratase n=1 Tax=Aquirhabdus parva TaxID=2283318 RepID=A0A345P763_9GAMM|nr:NAD(P)H-hydrate dehydratase [Aquirhabdus parva]AXI03122.1 NAD(P)H-hydrate dehydratase [Aquirhabdus parva]
MAQRDVNILILKQIIRTPDSHKGSHGSVAVIGGNIGMLGAALLSGRAAFAAGAGKVWLNVVDQRLAVDPFAPELMIRSYDGDLTQATALAVGPGLGADTVAHTAIERSFMQSHIPTVFDADALNMISRSDNYRNQLHNRTSMAILTPHPAEAGRLLGCDAADIQDNRLKAAERIAERYHSIVVLKGDQSIVFHPSGEYVVNSSGGPALAVAGQGDVLTGVIAALLGQGVDHFEAASLGAYIHGLAGDLYVEQARGDIGLTASAMPRLISQVLNRLLHPLVSSSAL